ncbi:MAG: hypothetical protein HY644_13480 [Acidobacteria bacterium]|nr:hypothetical protein [Acidobacteriota bacterium]
MGNYRLASLEVKGFRGFPESAGAKEFKFDERCTLLFGVQGGAKSSALSAVEWCVFGDKVANMSDTGIQERKDWLVRNKRSSEASVQVTFEQDGKLLKVYRSDRKGRGKPQFYYLVNDGSRHEDEERLRVMLGVELPDYMSCVHLHQEAINALLIEAPNARKNALDRLLGLADLRNLFDGITRAKVADELKDIDKAFNSIEDEIRVAMQIKRNDLVRAVDDARAHTLQEEELSLERARARCETVAAGIQGFANDYGLTAPTLPDCQTLEHLEPFVNSGKEAVRKLRDEQPDLKRQTELLKSRSDLNRLKADFESKQNALTESEGAIEELKNTHGEPPVVVESLRKLEHELLQDAADRLNTKNNRAGVIRETLKFLESPQGERAEKCPVCEQDINAAHIRQHLREWQQKMEGAIGPIEKEIKQFESEQKNLKAVLRQFRSLQDEIESKTRELRGAISAIATALRKDISEAEDPLVLVTQEIAKVDEGLEAIRNVVEKSNKRLNGMDDGLEDVKRIIAVLNLQKDIEDLSKVKDSPEYKQVKEARRATHAFGDRVETIGEAIHTVLLITADAKVKSTKTAISAIYRELAQRSDFPDIEINPEKYEVMAVRDGESVVALQILNKGDINCAALSIFLALATSEDLTHNIGFIVLDDPSQSLDPAHKERLANILNRVLDGKQLVIATSEEDFGVHLRNKLTKKKKIYTLEKWTEDTGPEVKVG